MLGTRPAHRLSAAAAARGWRKQLKGMLTLVDFVVITVVVFVTQILWLGAGAEFRGQPYWLISAVIALAWTWFLSLNDSRSHRILGAGWTEYLRVIAASLRLFAGIAIIAYLAKADIARGFLLISLPTGVVALLIARLICRAWLRHRRAQGAYLSKTLLVGTPTAVSHLIHELHSAPDSGFVPVGACIPASTEDVYGPIESVEVDDDADVDAEEPDPETGVVVPIVGTTRDVIAAMRTAHADTVVIASTDELDAGEIKAISWALESSNNHMLLAPSIMDVAGPRMHIRPVAGLPLIHVETPSFSLGQRFVKRTFDLVSSGLGILVLSPFLLILALLVRITSPGPALFVQKRIGRGGKPFRMVKFRSMVVDAEEKLEELRDQQSDFGNDVMFKMKDDPRVTKIGRVMRKFSLDELPQLFNVFVGSMSLIGPRPPLPSEVEEYATHVHRRFLMKPGITGLWQVNGRSTLTWEETVRLDLNYVENWSLANDVLILFQTVRVVLAPGETAH